MNENPQNFIRYERNYRFKYTKGIFEAIYDTHKAVIFHFFVRIDETSQFPQKVSQDLPTLIQQAVSYVMMVMFGSNVRTFSNKQFEQTRLFPNRDKYLPVLISQLQTMKLL